MFGFRNKTYSALKIQTIRSSLLTFPSLTPFAHPSDYALRDEKGDAGDDASTADGYGHSCLNASSLEKILLITSSFGFPKVAQPYADEPIALLWSHGHSLVKRGSAGTLPVDHPALAGWGNAFA